MRCLVAVFDCMQAIVTPEARNKSLDLVSDEEVRNRGNLGAFPLHAVLLSPRRHAVPTSLL